MGVLVRDLAVRRPACVTDPGGRLGAVETGLGLQLVEIAHRTDVVETLVLEESKAGRVVTAILEALQALDEKVLSGSRPHVSDDPAHPIAPFALDRVPKT